MSVSGYILEPIREDDEFVLYRGRGRGTRTDKPVVLVLKPAAARPRLQSLNKLKHEYSLRDELLSEWAIRPLSLSQDDNGQATLVLECPGGEFFFQAEDGIRDVAVTGVQTCALPI